MEGWGSNYSPGVIDADHSLSSPKTVRGEEPHPTRGGTVTQNTADLKE